MNILAALCICLAVCLWFPLPRKYVTKKHVVKIKNDAKVDPTQLELSKATSTEILCVLQMIQLGISSGMTISDALVYSLMQSPKAAALELENALNQFRIGHPLARGLEEITITNPRWQLVTDILIAALNTGSPIGDQLADAEYIIQSAIDTEKLKRIKSVAVKSVLPLGLCFLPAFILLAVLPIVAGFIGGFIK
jgi:Flp pilus assembly protein TadB